MSRIWLKENIGFVTPAYIDKHNGVFVNESKIKLTPREKQEVNNEDALYMVGVIQRADTPNGNGRIYPFAILEHAVNLYKKNFLNEGNAFGEIAHRDDPEIDWEKTAIKMVDIWWEGKDLYGKMKITSNSLGRDVKNLIKEDGAKMGISSRSLGSVLFENGYNIVQDDLEIICWDLVWTPSTQNAYISMMENLDRQNKNYIVDNLNNSDKFKTSNLNEVKNILKTLV